MTINGAIAGMVVGAVTVVSCGNTMAATGIYEIIPGFILATISIIVFSLLSKAPSKDVTARFDQANDLYEKEMQELKAGK